MSFATLSGTWVLAGLAGLAAGLFALQQLRTRYRDVTVVTTLFWKQVVDEAPVRKFRGQFRHPLAYLLVLAICALVWLSFAEPGIDEAKDQTFHVLVLDGSAGMAAGDRFQVAVEALTREVSKLPAGRRQVIWSGAEIRPLLNPGEHELLLARRLARLSPEAAPASVERLLRQLSASPRGDASTSVLVFGDAPVRQPVLALMPASFRVGRATSLAPLAGNAGITALGVADAASGAWDTVDVFVNLQRTADWPGSATGTMTLDVNGQTVPTTAVVRVEAPDGQAGSEAFVVHDLPADGGLFTIALTSADSLASDNSASVRLPRKPILKVQVSASLAASLGPVLGADAGVALVDGSADVVIRRAGESVGGTAPALEFVRAALQPQAFLLTHPETLDPTVVLAHAVDDIGLRQIDAMTLAQESGRPIEVSITPGRQWRFSVWEELLSDDFNFTRSRAFPLFVANAIRWLAGAERWHPYVAAGRPLPSATAGADTQMVDASGRVLDPIGTDFVPARAGEVRMTGATAPLAVSLLDPAVTTGARDEALQMVSPATRDVAAGSSLASWLLALALLLLAAEWYFFQMGRMP